MERPCSILVFTKIEGTAEGGHASKARCRPFGTLAGADSRSVLLKKEGRVSITIHKYKIQIHGQVNAKDLVQ